VALAYRGLWRVENAFRTLKTPLELRPLFHTSEAGIRGHVQACVLAYALVRLIEDRLDAAGLDLNAREALQDLARIQRAPLHRAGITVTKTSTASEQQQRLLAAIGAAIPERHAAMKYKPRRRSESQTRYKNRSIQVGAERNRSEQSSSTAKAP